MKARECSGEEMASRLQRLQKILQKRKATLKAKRVCSSSHLEPAFQTRLSCCKATRKKFKKLREEDAWPSRARSPVSRNHHPDVELRS